MVRSTGKETIRLQQTNIKLLDLLINLNIKIKSDLLMTIIKEFLETDVDYFRLEKERLYRRVTLATLLEKINEQGILNNVNVYEYEKEYVIERATPKHLKD